MITPSPGYYLIQPITKESENPITIVSVSEQPPTYSLGEVIGVGGNLVTDSGTVFEPFFKIGDTVWYQFSGEIGEKGKEIKIVPFRYVVAKQDE